MAAFIMGCLAVCMVAVLLALSVQFIRLEKHITDASQWIEATLKREYNR